MSALGHSEKSTLELKTYALRLNADVWISHLRWRRSLFPQEDSLFWPLGNFAANRLLRKGRVTRDGPDIDEIPSIFPVIREFDGRRAVRCRLPTQPH
jgi:hypothetical protein